MTSVVPKFEINATRLFFRLAVQTTGYCKEHILYKYRKTRCYILRGFNI